MCVSLGSLLKALGHSRVSLTHSVAEHSNPPMSKGRRHEAAAIEISMCLKINSPNMAKHTLPGREAARQGVCVCVFANLGEFIFKNIKSYDTILNCMIQY